MIQSHFECHQVTAVLAAKGIRKKQIPTPCENIANNRSDSPHSHRQASGGGGGAGSARGESGGGARRERRRREGHRARAGGEGRRGGEERGRRYEGGSRSAGLIAASKNAEKRLLA